MATLHATVLGNNGASSGTGTITFTIPGSAAAGMVAVLTLSEAGTQPVTSITGGAGGTWNLRSGPDVFGGSGQSYLYTRTLAAGDVGATITVTWGATQRGTGVMDLWADATETGLTVGVTDTGTGLNWPTVTAAAGAVVYYSSGQRSASPPAPDVTLPTGYTQAGRSATAMGSGASISTESFYQIAPAAGSYGGESVAIGSGTPSGGSAYALAIPSTAAAVPTTSLLWSANLTDATSLDLGWIVSSGASARAVVSTASDLSSPVYGSAAAPSAQGWVHSRVTGLTPATLYYVGVEVDGTLLADGRGSFRTLAATRAASKILSGSCQNIATQANPQAYVPMAADAADFFVHLGDLHYAAVMVATSSG